MMCVIPVVRRVISARTAIPLPSEDAMLPPVEAIAADPVLLGGITPGGGP